MSNMIRNDRFFGILTICFSLLILFPKNINTLFYYDDNPIRFSAAKKLAYGNINTIDELIASLSFGSAEIYIPFFFISRIFNMQNDELVYNFASLFYFVLSCLIVIFYLGERRKILEVEKESVPYGITSNSNNDSCFPSFTYIIVIFCILGISAVVRGQVHWLLSSSIFTIIASRISLSQNVKIRVSDYIILGLIHFISPPLIIFSAIFSFVERRIDIFFIPFLIFFVKFLVIHIVLVKYIMTFLSPYVTYKNFMVEDKMFLPIDFGIILRLLTFDYFNLSFIFVPLIYLIAFRAVFTVRKDFIILAFIYYFLVFFNGILLKLWENEGKIPKLIIIFSTFVFSPNPIRFAPLFLVFSLLHIKKIKFDNYFRIITLIFFLVRALLSFFGFQALPEKIPESVDYVVEYILNNTKKGDRILVEGDRHIFEKGKLIHPLYDSHILPYVIAKVEDRNFIGLGVPWGPFFSPFIAGKFKEKPLASSEILSFILENNINYVLCWTNECENFFTSIGKKVVLIDKFKIVHLID